MSILFDQFKAFLGQILNDPDVIRKNYVLQNAAFLADMQARLDGLTPDVSLQLDYINALDPSLGMLVKDTPTRSIKFKPSGFANYLSAFREGTIGDPARFWRCTSTDPHGARYLLADQTAGVILLNENLEAMFRFPGFGPITDVEYSDASAVCVWEDTGTLYVAIACYSHHIVQIYNYTTFAYVATIGLLDTPGHVTGRLNHPRGVAIDPATSVLYISCENGTPAGATMDRGFITLYDVTTPAAPVFTSIPYFYGSTGALLDGQVHYPNDVYLDPVTSLLWVTNTGANEVGAFAASTGLLARLLETSGLGYTFREPCQVYIQDLLGGYSRIYVANGAAGTVEEFNAATLQHQHSYGVRASEDELSLYNRLSPEVYGAIGYARAVVSDRVWIDGIEADVFVVGDNMNKRLARFNQSAYSDQNFINFEMLDLAVPIAISGWTLSGDIPIDLVSVQYRFADTEIFRDLPQQAVVPATSSVQFRLSAQLDPAKFVKTWTISQLRIYGTQA